MFSTHPHITAIVRNLVKVTLPGGPSDAKLSNGITATTIMSAYAGESTSKGTIGRPRATMPKYGFAMKAATPMRRSTMPSRIHRVVSRPGTLAGHGRDRTTLCELSCTTCENAASASGIVLGTAPDRPHPEAGDRLGLAWRPVEIIGHLGAGRLPGGTRGRLR
jgi:hypothetical protein